jgi:CDP-paratose 2-epimerase
MTPSPASTPLPQQSLPGLCQWFHYEAFDDLELAIDLLAELGVRRLRTGISWADFHRPGGKDWYDHQMGRLAEAGLDVLLSVWHTPPSLAEAPSCAAPPERLEDYAAFIAQVVIDYGDTFADLELWNEPNNLYKWDFERYDPDWRKFATMVAYAGEAAHRFGKRTVLGGMMPVDPDWLELVERHGGLEHVDVIAVHGFPGMWWEDAPSWDCPVRWRGWGDKIATIARVAGGRPIWITETGYATWDRSLERPSGHEEQAARLATALTAPAERVYWYSLVDLHPDRDAIEGFHVDEHEYHLGLVTFDGRRKPAFDRWKELVAPAAPERARAATGTRR